MDKKEFTILENSIFSGITDKKHFYITDSYQTQISQLQNASVSVPTQLQFNFQVQRNNIIDRNWQVNATPTVVVNLGNAAAGENVWVYGDTASINNFPLNHWNQSVNATIAGTTVSSLTTNTLDQVLTLQSNESLSKFNNGTVTMRDSIYGNLADASGALNNPNNTISKGSYDNFIQPRGAFPVTQTILHTLSTGATDESTISTNIADTWVITLTFNTIEPILLLSPLISNGLDSWNQDGFININEINLTLQGGDFKNMISYAYPQYITGAGITGSFADTPTLQYKYYSLFPHQIVKLPKSQILPYTKFDRLISQSTATIAPLASTTLLSGTFTISNIPKLLLISAFCDKVAGISSSGCFLAIKGITLLFANQSTLLSNLNQYQLWVLSQKNGSQQSFSEFSGFFTTSSGIPSVPIKIPSAGAVLALSSFDLQLDEDVSVGVTSNYTLNIQLQVQNQYGVNANNVRIVVTPIYDGFYENIDGVPNTTTNIITPIEVQRLKLDSSASKVDKKDYEEFSGGLVHKGSHYGHSMLKKHRKVMKQLIKNNIMKSGGERGGETGGKKYSKKASKKHSKKASKKRSKKGVSFVEKMMRNKK